MSHHSDTVSRAVEQPGSEFTAPEIINSPTPHELAGQAIASLTALARCDGADFAEYACRVLAVVAANVGSLDALLATRPGSWEAGHVHGIVTAAAGDRPDDLLRFRTEPIHLWCDAEFELEQAGALTQIDTELDELKNSETEAYNRMFDVACTPEEAERNREIRATAEGSWLGRSPEDNARLVALFAQADALHSVVRGRAEADRIPEFVTYVAALDARHTADQHRTALIAEFRDSFFAAARAELERRGLALDVVVAESYTHGSDDLADEVSDIALKEAFRQIEDLA